MTASSASKVQKKPWKKVLYEKQDYPDNYTDKNVFLKDLKRNIDLKPVSVLEACLGANLLLQEFCTVVLFALVYLYIVNKWLETSLVLYSFSSASFLGFILYRVKYQGNFSKQTLGDSVRTVLTFTAFGQLFSPILHTLTDTISTDTIYTMSFLMFTVHLIFFDYGVNAAMVSKSLSLSAAMFASICLASRLYSPNEAFVLLTVATQLFVLFPILRKELKNSIGVTVIILLVDLYLLLQTSILVTVLFCFAVTLISLICPILFVRYQKYKDNIYGPWDEAVVTDIDNILFFFFFFNIY